METKRVATKKVWNALDSSKAFGLLWQTFSLVGLDCPNKHQWLYWTYAVIVNTFYTICMPICIFIGLWFLDKAADFPEVISWFLTFFSVSMKYFTILYFRSNLKAANIYLAKLDARCGILDQKLVASMVRDCRNLFFLMLITYTLSGIGFDLSGWARHQLVYKAWYPSFLIGTQTKYYIMYTYQISAQYFTVLQCVCNDSYPALYLMVMIGHLRALKARLERIGIDSTVSKENNWKELLLCMQDYNDLLSYFNCIRPVISWTSFSQFTVSAISLCFAAFNLTAFDHNTAQLFTLGFYFCVILSQLFPTCWYVNALEEEFHDLTTAIYSCIWYNQSAKLKKSLIIFMQRSQKSVTIAAGNFIPVTLQTFLAMIKFAFSMHTILNNMSI